MRGLERGRHRESLEKSISHIAFAYGFSMPPILVSRKTVSLVKHDDPRASVALAVMKQAAKIIKPTQLWGGARGGRTSTLTFGTLGTRSAIGNALIAKTAFAIADVAGFAPPAVSVSSVGDAESKRRFTRELTNFFKKNIDAVPPELKSKSLSEPDAVYRELLSRKDPLIERAPRTIDYLSENSRKTMMDTLSLFESVGIPYSLDARMDNDPDIHSELIFGIETTEKDGRRVRIASGGRYNEAARKRFGIQSDAATAISITLPKSIDVNAVEDAPVCFVVHVGEAARLKAFTLLEALWKAHVAVTQTLMAESFREQIDTGKSSGAKYLAIIGQREALDNTIILRNTGTQMQVTMPQEKLEGYVSRVNR